jgi:hypothetical protein
VPVALDPLLRSIAVEAVARRRHPHAIAAFHWFRFQGTVFVMRGTPQWA